MAQANYFSIGGRAWSYQTAILDVLPDGRSIGNATKYSVTTSKHQTMAGVKLADVVVTNVPCGTKNLAQWYAHRVEMGDGKVGICEYQYPNEYEGDRVTS